MKRFVMMLAVASLLIAAAPYGRTTPGSDAAKNGNPDLAQKAEDRGDLARVRKDYASAVAYYMAALRYSRQNARVYNKLGIVELQLGERGAARKNFGLALKYDPKLISAVNNLGAVALIDKKYKIAAGYFKKALAADETVASTHLNLAEAWMGMREVDHAMTEYARALELDADLLTNTGDGVIAQVSTPEQRARIYFLIAKSYARRGNIEGALDYLTRAKQLNFPEMSKVYSDPDFTSLWKDPRLEKIVKR
ncbi:MAG: tetratricopeptide repeat protein [Terracidiphilus sp.]